MSTNPPTDAEVLRDIERRAQHDQYERSMQTARDMLAAGVPRSDITQELLDIWKYQTAMTLEVIKAGEPDFALERAEYRGRDTGAQEAVEDFAGHGE